LSRIEELERRVQHDPASIAFGALAEEYRRSGRLDDAVAVCLSGLERHPSYLSARVTLGRALQALGRITEARDEFERVIAVAPDNLAAIRALAELHDGPASPAAPAPPAAPAAPVSPAAPASPASPALPALEAWLAALDRERAAVRERL
jgi:tetratricopeptide (TPR) repeat protein